MGFLTSLEPSISGIPCMSPSFWLGGSHVGNVPGNTSRCLHNTIHNDALYFLSIFSKCGIMPSGQSLLPYSMSYKNNTGLLDVFNYSLYITQELLMVPSENSQHTNITLVSRFFQIHFICTWSVTLIVRAIYSICSASKRWNRFCSCLPSAIVNSKAHTQFQLFGYIQLVNYIYIHGNASLLLKPLIKN